MGRLSPAELAPAKEAALRGGDPKPVTRIAPRVIELADAQTACDLVCSSSENRDIWLPEALTLFNTSGLSPGRLRRMTGSVFGWNKPADPAIADSLARSNARLGRYGFSFPQWRFLAQAFNGASLLEHYGMRRLRRATDIADAALKEPHRDLFGPGFVWRDDTTYVEYRRAYIVCSDASEGIEATLVIRNNSYYFGRDRLPDPVYVSWRRLSPEFLRNINPGSFSAPSPFTRWQDSMHEDLPEKARRVTRLIDFLDGFDNRLSAWLAGDRQGFAQLAAFLKSRAGQPGPVPFVAGIDRDMPPWFPFFAQAVTPEFLEALEKSGPDGLKKLFTEAGRGPAKLVLLSGPHGDPPIRPEPARPAPFSN